MVRAGKYRITGSELIENFIIFAEALVERSMDNQNFLKKAASYK